MTLKNQIEEIISEKSMLKHPFYQAWTDGKLTKEQLKNYSLQYFHNVLAFPTFLSGVHFNTPAFDGNVAVRQEILNNLIEEEHGERNHPKLWRNFAEALGALPQELNNTEMLSETKGLVDTFRRVCISSPFYIGLAALYVYESQIPEVAKVKIDGLKKFYDITQEADFEFFTVHSELDIYHSQTEMALIEKYADSPEKQDEVLKAVRECANSLWKFLDGVYENYCSDLAVCMN
jgi:pyrroloquinoline-quinone synthase